MGKKGQEVVRLDRQALIEDLTKAYADEWLAHYYYMLAANLAGGIQGRVLAEVLEKRAMDELGHANRIARRILELGGEPPREWSRVASVSTAPPFRLPQNLNDTAGIIRAVLEQERHAIATYQALVEKSRLTDTATHELAEDLLVDEVKDEEEDETLLGE